ncbi:DUF742 domain-containing protein [Umezawaea sp. NPDC059074]|uniref:DUF742 domain-containing protein n=1 Tax=Umezawaea sp. NPDC059074 TaxID=3346716 RepID=UPI0036B99596
MTRKKRATGFHPSSFGGWPDYQQWADNDFRPCPEPPVEPEPIPEPEPEPFTTTIATTLWSPDPVTEEPVVEPPPVEPLSPPGWQAFAEVEPIPEPLLWRPAADEDPLAETAWPLPAEVDQPVEQVVDEPVAEPPVWEAFTKPESLPVIDRQALLEGWPPESRDRWPSVEWADEDLVVRPYVRTHGRVEQGYDLRLETLVSVTRLHEREPANPALTPDAALICGLCCAGPQSVAEVSAHLNAPLGVARVLIADAIEAGLVFVAKEQRAVDARPSREMLERIREGLMRMS